MATYRFTLTTPDGAQTFGADQVSNWSDIKPSFVLNETYRGIFREFTSTFEFVKDARRTIIRAFDKYGYDVDIFLTIEVGNDNGEFSSFRQLAYRLRADIQGIEIGDLSVSLNFIDSGFVADIMNREDMEINLTLPEAGKIESVDGESVQAVDRLLWDTRLHDRRLIFNSKLIENDDPVQITKSGSAPIVNYYFPMSIKYNADKNFQNTYGQDTVLISGENFPNCFYLNSDKDRNIQLDLNTTIKYRTASSDYSISYVPYIQKISADNTSIESYRIDGYESESDGGINPDITSEYATGYIEFSKLIEIKKGESLIFKINGFTSGDTGVNYQYEIIVKDLSLTGTSLEFYDSTRADVILPYELFTQLLQYYTGKDTPFYSEFFGRKDLGYPENGPGAGVAVANGKMIRGFPYGKNDTDEGTVENYFNTSFKKAFESYNKIFNLAATIETIGRKQRVRIEPMEYFRNFEILADLGDSISEISRTVNPDKIYSEIKVGYKNKEYEELNGLFSFNGEMSFSTPLQTEAESLELINEWRADDIGIELTRRMQYKNNPSEDYRSDNDIFFIDCNIFVSEISDDYFIYPKRGSNYDSVSGIFEPDWAYNLNLSPKRCLYNWQDEITAGLFFKQNQYLKYIKGPKNSSLISKAPGGVEIIESEDVLISSLKNAKFIPEMIQISEAPFTVEDWENIKENRYGVIKFSHKGVALYGFIMDIEFDINKKTANFELLRANL